MKIKLSDLWRWNGTIERGPYLLLGAILFAVKYNLDRLLASVCFGRHWWISDYFEGGRLFLPDLHGKPDDIRFAATLVALALPFMWAGVVLTLRRLRSASLPAGLVVLFFVPVVKLVFFAVLAILPSREQRHERTHRGGLLGAFIPRDRWGSAAMGVFGTLLLTLPVVWLGTSVLGNYGWSLFLGLPFCMSFLSVLIFGYHEARSLGPCLGVACFSVLLAGVALLAVAFEGVICLLMALPLAGVMAVMGGVLGYAIQSRDWWRAQSSQIFSAVVILLPATMGLEHLEQPEPPLLKVTTAVEINTPPETVWRHVVEFSDLPPPTEWLFRLGVAYPVRAEIRGHGVGAVRHCNFSTGPFVEPIAVWDEPNLLKFSVTANPAPLEEWTPYREIHPPHLDGFLESKGGQFLLVRLPDGRTRLEGTTWYHHRMWPAAYWQVWSDIIIHRIHLRVLNHVKQLAEKDKP